MFSKKDMLRRFTDAYNKDPNSNLGKLIGIMHSMMSNVNVTLQEIDRRRSIDNANGETLDRFGTNIVQDRGAATDEVYRVLLKSKIARNLSTSDINTIIRVLALALDADPKDIKIKPQWSDPVDPEPAAISLIQVPIRRLNEVGMSSSQFGQIVQQTVAAGVRVRQIELTGTFRFSKDYAATETGPNGFSNVDQQDGGYFGDLYQPADDYELPI